MSYLKNFLSRNKLLLTLHPIFRWHLKLKGTARQSSLNDSFGAPSFLFNCRSHSAFPASQIPLHQDTPFKCTLKKYIVTAQKCFFQFPLLNPEAQFQGRMISYSYLACSSIRLAISPHACELHICWQCNSLLQYSTGPSWKSTAFATAEGKTMALISSVASTCEQVCNTI